MMRVLRKPGVAPALSSIALYAMLTLPFPGEAVSVFAALARPGVDVLILFALACAFAAMQRPRAITAWGLAIVTLFVTIYRFGSYVMPTYWQKPFEPYVDLLELDGLAHLFFRDRSLGMQIVLAIAAIGVAAAFVYLLVRLWRSTMDGLRSFRLVIPVAVGLQALVLFAWNAQAASFVPDESPKAPMLGPSMLGAAVDHVASVLASGSYQIERIVDERSEGARARIEALPRAFTTLDGANIYVLILESYGRQVSTRDGLRPRYIELMKSIDGQLASRAWSARSCWIRPSVSGGGSALAHLELVTGISVENRRIFNEVLSREIPALPALLRDAGYHTVNIEPAMPLDEWPEAAVLGFERDLFRSFFPYDGHRYHWGDMPDQYALAYAHERVLRTSDKPLFVQFVSVTGHAPFSQIPPYLEDWKAASQASSFGAEPAQRFAMSFGDYTSHPDLADAYFASVRYGLRVATGFASLQKKPCLVFILGDHQPPLRHQSEDASLYFDVPLHVLSNEPGLLDALGDARYTRSMLPDLKSSSWSATEFLGDFLRAYGR